MKEQKTTAKGSVHRNMKEKRLRPTSNKVREALFNILREKTINAVFLDLYAGTGAVGMAALKEGASEVVFVEPVRSYAGAIEVLLKKFYFAGDARIITKKAIPYVDWAEAGGLSFDIIFLDPPYHTDEIMRVLTVIGTSRILADDGIVIAEHFVKKLLPDRFDKLRKIKDYNYGDTVLSFYTESIHDENILNSGSRV
jgi:16S rRNA (guanine(966)-N(2))-methyltransferase RsmD